MHAQIGKRTAVRAELVDVYRTLADLAGILGFGLIWTMSLWLGLLLDVFVSRRCFTPGGNAKLHGSYTGTGEPEDPPLADGCAAIRL